MRAVFLFGWVFILCMLLTRASAAPDWIPDPTNAKWILFGGEKGIAEENGLYVHPGGAEGEIVGGERGGIPVGLSVRPGGGPGYFYLKADPWPQFRAWQGDRDLLLVVRYWDGASGSLFLQYDSSDPRVKRDPYPAGVWRRPEEWPQGLELKGDKTFKTASVRLPLAMFTKRCHGADFRLDPNSVDFALVGLALVRVPRQALPVIVTQELAVERATGFTSYGKGARMVGNFVQQADEPVMLEAECAQGLSLRGGHTPGLDAQASGGGYIHYVESSTYRFMLKTPGRYIAWERAFFPWDGYWNHTESMDGRPGTVISDALKKSEQGWEWVKAGTYELTAGEHTFEISYEGGARLDAIVFSRSEEPPDLAALRASYQGPISGEIWTTPVQPFDVAQWRQVTFALGGPREGVVYEYSTDGGKTWREFDPAAGLESLTPAGGGKDTIQFHLKVRGKAGQAPPLFGGGSLAYQAGPNNVRYLENARLKIGIDPYGVKSIFDQRSGKFVAQAPEAHDALALILTKPVGNASPTTWDLYNASLVDFRLGGTRETPALTMIHRLSNGIGLTTTARLLPSGQVEWQLAIDNPTELEVCEVRFPVIPGCALGDDPQDDWIFFPKCWGQTWQNPGANRASLFWGPSMRWTAIWDQTSGVYLGIEDPKFEDNALYYAGDPSGGVTLAAQQRILAKPRGNWQSGVYRLAVTGGDWHEAADIYRAYVAKALKPCEVAPHIKWLLDEWGGPNSNINPFVGWDVITTDGPYFWAANRQMTDGADSGYCGLYPWPSPAWGSTREFAQKLALRKATGGMYTPYHNFHLWAPGYGHYPRIGTFPKSRLPQEAPLPDDAWYARAAEKGYNGGYARLETDYFAQVGMAMGSREWREWLYDWTARYLDWGTDGMYYDQFNMIYGNGQLYPNFDTYGCWMPATLEVFSRIKRDSRAKDPYYTASGEVCNDVYGQYLDLHMTSGVWNRLEFYTYCNPNQILIDGAWNGGLGTWWGGPERRRFIWQCGARFENWTDPDFLYLRRAVKSLLYDAVFRDTVGLVVRDAQGRVLEPERVPPGPDGKPQVDPNTGPYRGVIGRWFLFKQGAQSAALVNLINAPVRAGATCTLSTKEFGPVTSAVAWTLDRKQFVVKGTQKGDTYTFPVPEAECSSVVLVAGRVRPLVEWSLSDRAAAPGVIRRFLLHITNPNAAPMSGSIRLRLPQGWPAPPEVRFGPLAPGASAETSVAFQVPPNAEKGRRDLWCDVTGDGLTFSAYEFISVNDPVLVDFRGNPGTYHVWVRNLTTQPLTGTVEVSAPAPLQVSCAREFDLPAEGEARIPVTVEGRLALREISEMSARVTIAGQTYEVVRGVMPHIPNADFESDSAGDMKPDWWMGRKVRDEWAYERLHLSTEAHSGKYSLLLDPPQAGEQFIRAYPTNGCWTPKTKYRVSVWIKCAAKEGVYVEIGGRRLGAGQTGPEWQQFAMEFTTGDNVLSGGWVGCSLINSSDQPAYFDDLVVEEVG